MITALAVAASVLAGACVEVDGVSNPTPGVRRVVETPSAASGTPAIASPTSLATTETATTSCAAPYPSGPATAETVFCADPARMERASVVRIVDGDTLRAIVDGVEEPVRLFGVDTPERGDACYDEATDVLRALVAVNGGQVLLVPDARNRDSYDRLLRYVYTPAGLSIDAALIAGGFGYAWTRDGALRDALVDVEAAARLEGRGCLWN
jgi:micrococcal nuclease